MVFSGLLFIPLITKNIDWFMILFACIYNMIVEPLASTSHDPEF